MRHLLLGPIALALAMPALAQTEPPRAEPAGAAEGAEVILGEVDDDAHPEMRLFVTVLRGGEPVLGLGDDDFEVSEDEVRQRPIAVEAQLPPLSVVLAIDTSGSMSERMEPTREAAARFAEGLDERDAVQLLRFAREIEAAPMTTTKAKVAEAIAALQARGDTALYDALMRSVELVAAREGRRAIVVLSDGVDDDGTGAPLSEATVDEVLARAGEVNVPIFAIGLGTAMDEAVLERVAEETGGVYLAAPEAGELAAVYDRIGEQLSGQYAVAYRSSLPPDGTARRVDVTALGARGSKSYRPEGMTPAPEPVAAAVEEEPSTGACAPALAMEAVRAELEQARSRYDQDLINITQRNAVRTDAVAAIEATVIGVDVGYPCMVSSMEMLAELYDDRLIDIVQRNGMRDHLAAPLGEACSGEATLDGVVACFERLADAYERGLIDIVRRNGLMDRAAQPLLDELAGLEDPDEALRRVNEVYEAGAMDIATRNALREAILQRE